MNSLKSLFFLGVLAAAACGVYVSLNGRSDSSVPANVFQGDSDKSAPPKAATPAGPVSNTPLGSAFAGTSHTSPGPGLASAFPPPPAAGPPSPPAAGGMSLFPSPATMGPGSVATASTAASVAMDAAGTAPPPVPLPPSPPGGDALPRQRSSFDMRSDAMGRDGSVPPPPGDAAASARDAVPLGKLDAVMRTVESKLSAGQVADAHLLLSSVYGDPQISPEQARQVMRLLDQMAATVIYSRQSLLEQPYRVQPGDTLEQIARRYNVPPELLAKINGIRDPRNLAPGRELKVIRGPFSALVDLGRRELTLMVQGRYAGRFPIDVAGPDAIAPGTYMVRDKKDVRPRLGDPVAGQVGTFLISLGGPAAIGDRNNAPVALGSRDLEDVFGILSLGSRVVIQR
jgi:hypothetical protein